MSTMTSPDPVRGIRNAMLWAINTVPSDREGMHYLIHVLFNLLLDGYALTYSPLSKVHMAFICGALINLENDAPTQEAVEDVLTHVHDVAINEVINYEYWACAERVDVSKTIDLVLTKYMIRYVDSIYNCNESLVEEEIDRLAGLYTGDTTLPRMIKAARALYSDLMGF